MKCSECKQVIKPGTEEAKRAEFRRQADGSVKVFGHQMPDGRLDEATGQLVRVLHSKEYWAEVKLARRGGSRTGGEISAWR